MSGITMSTMLEINGNPEDLYIEIGKTTINGTYAFTISRGPGHSFKPLISTTPVFKTSDDAVKEISDLLHMVHTKAITQLAKKNDLLTSIVNPNDAPVDISKTLNSERIKKILDDLRLHHFSATYKVAA